MIMDPARTSPAENKAPKLGTRWFRARMNRLCHADRRLCPVEVSDVLKLEAHDVAEAMRSAGVKRRPTLAQAKTWTIGEDDMPDWLAPLVDKADVQDPGRVAYAAGRARRTETLRQEVWETFGMGQKITGAGRRAVAARIALDSLGKMVSVGGDVSQLGMNERAALEWAHVDPGNQSTWFINDPDDSRRTWFPRSPYKQA